MSTSTVAIFTLFCHVVRLALACDIRILACIRTYARTAVRKTYPHGIYGNSASVFIFKSQLDSDPGSADVDRTVHSRDSLHG